MNTKDYALQYLKKGFSVIPLKSPSMVSGDLPEKEFIRQCKMPLVSWKPFQERLPTEQEVTDWFYRWPNANIAIITGKISNLVVFDLDSEHAVQYVEDEGGFTDRDFRNNTGLKLNSADILALLLETSRVEFKVSFPVRLKSTGDQMNVHRMNFYSRFFELAEEKIKLRKDGIVQQRRYRVFFNTLLGELFVNNLLAKFNDRIGLEFYALPDSAQLFYRRMLLHNNHSPIEFKLKTIANAAGLGDSNRTNLINTIERNIFEPLKDRGYIASFKRSEGLDGTRYIIRRASDKPSKQTTGDGGSVK